MITKIAGRFRLQTNILFLTLAYLNITLPSFANLVHEPSPYQSSPFLQRNHLGVETDGFLNNGNQYGSSQLFTSSSRLKEYAEVTKENVGYGDKSPNHTYIDGPGQPEMSSFKSVNADNMVDLFTGDFSYNIPLLDVGGYPVNIHYSSGISMDQDASWVGLGWNVNPGTVSRSMRGLPDDFDGTDTISKTQHIRDNKTIGASIGLNVELVGTPLNVGATAGIFHNTYNGYGTETGINASINAGSKSFGPFSGGYAISHNSQSGLSINPSLSVRLSDGEKADIGRSVNAGLSTNFNSRSGLAALHLNAGVRFTNNLANQNDISFRSLPISFPSASISFAVPAYTPSITMPFTSMNLSFRARVGGEANGISPAGIIEGYVSKQEIKEADQLQKVPAVGYLYYSNAKGRLNTLLDVNRERELNFNAKTTPHIAIPQYTYDVYSISGEGTGGMFRPYRGDVGYTRDYIMRTKSESDNISVDVGFGNTFHGGIDFNVNQVSTANGEWGAQNEIKPNLEFSSKDSTFQPVYFRNPGEKAISSPYYYSRVGDDDLMRIKLAGERQNIRAASSFITYKGGRTKGEIPVSSPLVKPNRDKRTQVITYLTASEASLHGLDKKIASYKENTIPLNCSDTVTYIDRVDGKVRKGNHLSEISVLNNDGRRYVYGTPAYNLEQKDVTFSVAEELAGADKSLVKYTPGIDNSTGNRLGKDHYFSKDSMPGYAHSFLLSAILSPDYVDISGDGISEDDLGDAVKFNYSRVYGNNSDGYQWRTPLMQDSANYNEGLKSYNRDDKASYIYGKKEVWYLNSIESKTMIAVFKVSSDRKDAYAVKGENGGINTAKPLRRLDSIELYTKADLIRSSKKARPIKTVHFAYSYTLCKGAVGNPATGKLTLDSIWFSYNGNRKGKLNPYVFKYHASESAYNPNYHPKHYDRWGNYKDPASNPQGMSNADYPFAVQDSALAARYAAAWTLDEVRLPSGGRMKITYESDDYGFVQNKRATQFFQIAAVSPSASVATGKYLYAGNTDHLYIFINSEADINSKEDLYQKFLFGIDPLYFKLSVKVPTDRWGGGYESIPAYAKVADYGLVPGNSKKFWIKLEGVNDRSPLTQSALQYLRLNLPSKAYRMSEPGDDIELGDGIKMVASSFTEVLRVVNGFDDQARREGACREIDPAASFIRLASPTYRKHGGGLRVKRIIVWDNWSQMTGRKEATYGQEYSYTTTTEVQGQHILISSGVAAYEPMIGAEENPFRTPIDYSEKIAPLAPANNLFSENPLGESFFPAPTVGYSKVRVRTIHAKAKSANGWQETQFYTSKEFPTIVDHTLLDDESKKPYAPKLRSLLKINSLKHITLSQGFKVELNDMHGKVKMQASYAETDPKNPISYVQNYYKVDDDKAYQKHLNNNVWAIDSLNGNINTEAQIGKDIEVMVDMREQTSTTIANNKSINTDFFFITGLPFVLPSYLPMPQREEVRFRSAAVVKVIQRYGILDSVVVMDKGSVVSTKNMVYDGETGEVVLSRTNNEFNDPVYNFHYPAHWAYSGMGAAYKNIDAVFRNLHLINGKLYYPDRSVMFPAEKYFESGDEILLTGSVREVDPLNCLKLKNRPIFSFPFPNYEKPLPNKAWAVAAEKGKEKHRGAYFIDKDGRPITGTVSEMRILRSGKRNMLTSSVGSIVSLDSPIKEVSSGKLRIVIDSTTKIVNTSAVTYSDLWKVENSRYEADSCYTITTNRTVERYAFPLLLKKKGTITHSEVHVDDQKFDTLAAVASFDFVKDEKSFKGRYYRTKAIFNYDLNDIPADATIHSAKMTYYPAKPDTIWKLDTLRFACGWSPFGGTIYCTRHNHNWGAETNTYAGNFKSAVRRIHTAWNGNTKYLDFGVSSQNEVKIETAPAGLTAPVVLSVTNLIKDVVENKQPYYGFMFELQSPSQAGGVPHFYSILNYYETGGPVLEISYSYSKDTCVKVCRNYIKDSTANPYSWGMLGNWRVDRAYTYYHDRQESDASSPSTNIRKEGTLKSFTPYWKFTDSIVLANADTSKWVWNSASSLYNRKGFEIENYDPLGRYNAALYAYNQTLPSAVVQNSRYQEALFDGFEDYGYKTKGCTACPTPREVDFLAGSTGVDTTQVQSHTGRYSIKVNAGAQAKVEAPVFSNMINTAPAAVSLRVDSSAVYAVRVAGKGQGLTATYEGSTTANCNFFNGDQAFSHTAIQGPINYDWSGSAPWPGMCNRHYTVTWKGKLQAPYTDVYRFYVKSGGGMEARLNNMLVATSITPGFEGSGFEVALEAGKLYDLEVRFKASLNFPAYASLMWTREFDPQKVVVPKNLMYKVDASTSDTAGSIVNDVLYYCIKPNQAKLENMMRPKFSPLQNKKMVVSAWVRMDGNDCYTAPPLENVLAATVTDGSTLTTIYLQRTGVRIEGWQRYEAVFTTTSNTTSVKVSAQAPSDRAIFVDDIRVQPFNSSMKSYVYDPVSLRLMAELDENNFASFYEYDDDGTLIRLKKETERGIMTVKETRSALLKEN